VTGNKVRQVFEAMLPRAEIDRLCQEFGVVHRMPRSLGIAEGSKPAGDPWVHRASEGNCYHCCGARKPSMASLKVA
jgi:hypothetical protein